VLFFGVCLLGFCLLGLHLGFLRSFAGQQGFFFFFFFFFFEPQTFG